MSGADAETSQQKCLGMGFPDNLALAVFLVPGSVSLLVLGSFGKGPPDSLGVG